MGSGAPSCGRPLGTGPRSVAARGTRALGRCRRPAEPSTLMGTGPRSVAAWHPSPRTLATTGRAQHPHRHALIGTVCADHPRPRTRTAGGMGLPGAGPSGHPERLPVGVCACGSQFSIMLKSRALHEHDRRLVGFRADAIVIMFEKRCREVRVSKNFG